jgi:hypothetical protein
MLIQHLLTTALCGTRHNAVTEGRVIRKYGWHVQDVQVRQRRVERPGHEELGDVADIFVGLQTSADDVYPVQIVCRQDRRFGARFSSLTGALVAMGMTAAGFGGCADGKFRSPNSSWTRHRRRLPARLCHCEGVLPRVLFGSSRKSSAIIACCRWPAR